MAKTKYVARVNPRRAMQRATFSSRFPQPKRRVHRRLTTRENRKIARRMNRNILHAKLIKARQKFWNRGNYRTVRVPSYSRQAHKLTSYTVRGYRKTIKRGRKLKP